MHRSPIRAFIKEKKSFFLCVFSLHYISQDILCCLRWKGEREMLLISHLGGQAGRVMCSLTFEPPWKSWQCFQ